MIRDQDRTGAHFLRIGQVIAAAALSVMVWQGPADAQAAIPVPENCTALATVHKTLCAATTILTCGAERRSVTYVDGALEHEHIYDADWALTGYNFETDDTVNLRHEAGSGASMSFAQLIESGMSPAEGTFVMKTGRVSRAFVLSGENRLTGEVVMLGDEPFLAGEVTRLFEVKPGAGGLEFGISFLVSADRQLFIEGAMTRNAYGSGEEILDHTPMRFASPGEPGFLANRSEFGCND